MPAKNLLMFSIDDMRAVSDFGHFTPIVSTPNLDRLAAMGTTFDRAITQVPICNPSRTSVMSGQQPSETGVLENATPWFERVDPASTLPAVLKAAGVYVAMYGKHFHGDVIPPAHQRLMFDEFVHGSKQGEIGEVIEDDVSHQIPFRSGRYGGSPEDLQDTLTANAAVNFLQNTAQGLAQPFFLGVGIFKPHVHWWVPPEYYDLYDPAAIRAALRQSLADGTIIPGEGEYFDVPPMSNPSPRHQPMAQNFDLWADYIHAYLASVSFADAKIGEVLDALEADPALAADTAILLWSDHGYHLGDKDRWEKFTHWREATEVPFIVVDPDQPGGQTAEQIVSLVDIFPTVLDLMGVAAPAGLRLSGNSLLPIVQDVDIEWYDPAAGKGVALTTIYGSVSIRAHVPGMGDLRYTRYPDGNEELYNLDSDPGEHVNRIDLATGRGLTWADNRVLAVMSGLMDEQLADAGVLVSDGSGRVNGSARDELLSSTSGPGFNVLAGRNGDDTYVLYADTWIVERVGGGFDGVVINDLQPGSIYAMPANVELARVLLGATGNDAGNRIFGGDPPGVLDGAGGNDFVDAGAGDDILKGGDGRDSLAGEGGADVMDGGLGSDTLRGGAGHDRFLYKTAWVSTTAASDLITRFDAPGATAGDVIDLRWIDADTRFAGNQTFTFGSAAAGGLRMGSDGTKSVLLGNTDADAAVELRIAITDGAVPPGAYTVDDFIL